MFPQIVRIIGIIATLTLATANATLAQTPSAGNQDVWPNLAKQIFGEKVLSDGTGLLALDMPERAEDAAVVPLGFSLTLLPGDRRWLKTLTLIIDDNPSPVAASFTFGDKAQVGSLSTRVRVDSYTNVHAVAELSDGKLYVVKRYVKASGGCSAPALKDANASKLRLGEMRFRVFSQEQPHALREAQLMIRHPNNSGLQMDQVTHLYVPAFFIEKLRMWQGNELIFTIEFGISISENPSLRFSYLPSSKGSFRAKATDSEQHTFKGEWPAAGM
jgi:sulfur-oxidizing protein SoxY